MPLPCTGHLGYLGGWLAADGSMRFACVYGAGVLWGISRRVPQSQCGAAPCGHARLRCAACLPLGARAVVTQFLRPGLEPQPQP